MKFDINNLKEHINNSEFKNEIKELMKTHHIDLEYLKSLIKTVTIYCDYDEVLADLMSPWVENINKNNGTNWKKKDVVDFYWFDKQPNGKVFLDNPNVYDEILPKKDAIPFLKTLEKNKLLDNLSIVTATYDKNVESKSKHIQKYFKDYISRKHTTSYKWELDYTNAILIDDGAHNVENTVIKNPYAHAFVLDYKHNQHLYTGKRIIRIKSLNEIFNYLPLIVLKNYDRQFNPEKQYLRKEAFEGKFKKTKELEEIKKLSNDTKIELNMEN
jgi:5'(3')-deoxyribonucleotidase